MLVEIVLFVSILFAYFIWKKPSNLPPGPRGLPLLGYLPLRTPRNDLLKELNQKYGNVVSFKLGTQDIVIIFDYKLIKEAFTGQNVADRPHTKMISLLYTGGKFGIVSTSGQHWQRNRQFTLRHLRDLGMGKSKLVGAVQHEAMELVDELKKQAGKPAPFPRALNACILNIIWQMIGSKRYNFEDKVIVEYETLLDNFLVNLSRIILPDFFTWMNYIPRFILRKITNEDDYEKMSGEFLDMMKAPIAEHIQTLDENNPRDFIDAYLIEMNKQKDDPTSTMSVEDLAYSLADLFDAGSETIATTLRWSIFYLTTHPDVQSKLQKEIDEVLPKGTQPTIQDKQNFPYLEAFTNEVLRHSSLVGLSLFHMSSTDFELDGHRIPKGAIVLAGTMSCHYNPNYFESPEEFRPERFLNSEGKFVMPKDGFFPFGLGKRHCIGEGLARMELFIFLTALIQNFSFSAPPGETIDLAPRENILFNFPNLDQNIFVTIRE